MLPVREKVAHTAVRIKFSKTGDLQYISHLDLHRTFTRLLVRAGVPVWYSEGFSPHPRLVFATPLSVGAESLCEFLDVFVEGTPEEIDTDVLHWKLRDSGICGLQVLNVYLPTTKFTAITDSEYILNLFCKDASEALAARCGEILSAKPLTVLKRTKSGEKDVDISAQIHAVSASYRAEENCIVVKARLCADSAGFLNPEYLVKALKDALGILSDVTEEYSVLRTGVFAGEEAFR